MSADTPVGAAPMRLPAPPQFTQYDAAYTTTTAGLVCGAGTGVRILTLAQTLAPASTSRHHPTLTITATVELTATVGVARTACAGCGVAAPAPADDDALWFIVENHDHNRLVFADAENAQDERDRYPVKGWTQGAGGVLCAGCTAAVASALAARKAARSMPR